MNKTNLALTSLIAAIPAWILLALLLINVIPNFGNLPMVLMVAMILLLAVAGAMALFPAWAMVYHGGRKEKVAKADTKKAKTEAVPSVAEEEDVAADFDDEQTISEAATDDDLGFDGNDEFEFDEDEDEDF